MRKINKELQEMNKDELIHMMYDEDLSLQDLLFVKKRMKEFDFDNFDYEHINALIEDEEEYLESEKNNEQTIYFQPKEKKAKKHTLRNLLIISILLSGRKKK